jgi:hypothetical protein
VKSKCSNQTFHPTSPELPVGHRLKLESRDMGKLQCLIGPSFGRGRAAPPLNWASYRVRFERGRISAMEGVVLRFRCQYQSSAGDEVGHASNFNV